MADIHVETFSSVIATMSSFSSSPHPDAQEEMVESGIIHVPEFAETVSEEGEDMVRGGERGRERWGSIHFR